MKKPLMLMILDGWGVNPEKYGNAILQADTPNYDKLTEMYPHTTLQASGLAVGLPEGQMGNSEVGHLNLGAGRIVYQDFTRISKDIDDGGFYKNEVLIAAMENAKKDGKVLHLMGLLSDGGVHSHYDHLAALLKMAKIHEVPHVYVHAFLDGRDVPPANAKTYIERLEKDMETIGIGAIATISGRYYAMDRDTRWDRTQRAYDAMVRGIGKEAHCALEAVGKSYARSATDEFMEPTVILNDFEKPKIRIEQGDSIIFFNFRPDRARQLTYAFCNEDFDGFKRKKGFLAPHYVCFTEYDADVKNADIAFKPLTLDNILGEVLSRQNLKQLRIAETEKYAHVTFFFNGGSEVPFPGEDRCLIPSPKVATYDLKPEMSAYEVSERVIEKIAEDIYDVFVLNFANPDMVGHTGIMDAAVAAVEAVDKCVGEVVEAVLGRGGVVLLTADHGNADQVLDPKTGGPFTAHTTNPVPLIYIGEGAKSLRTGGLADVAPTMLDILNIEKPREMTGRSLIEND